jgi:hypothetical protein
MNVEENSNDKVHENEVMYGNRTTKEHNEMIDEGVIDTRVLSSRNVVLASSILDHLTIKSMKGKYVFKFRDKPLMYFEKTVLFRFIAELLPEADLREFLRELAKNNKTDAMDKKVNDYAKAYNSWYSRQMPGMKSPFAILPLRKSSKQFLLIKKAVLVAEFLDTTPNEIIKAFIHKYEMLRKYASNTTLVPTIPKMTTLAQSDKVIETYNAYKSKLEEKDFSNILPPVKLSSFDLTTPIKNNPKFVEFYNTFKPELDEVNFNKANYMYQLMKAKNVKKSSYIENYLAKYVEELKKDMRKETYKGE